LQEPLAGRFALHATVRHAVWKKTKPDPAALFEHYVALLERDPSRFDLEQTHLFAAMDHAADRGDVGEAVRVQRLVAMLEGG
jgi:hypothetical protein